MSLRDNLLSIKDRKSIRDRKIRALYQNGAGLSMDQIVPVINGFLKKQGWPGVSKTTVFWAVNGRKQTKKTLNRKQKVRRKIKNKLLK